MNSVETEYDEVLDTVMSAVVASYGDKEIDAALDVVDLKKEGYETEFDRHMRRKKAGEQKIFEMKGKIVEEKKRAQRTMMSLPDMITELVHKPVEEHQR